MKKTKLQELLSTKWDSSSKNILERKELKVTCKPLLIMLLINGKKYLTEKAFEHF